MKYSMIAATLTLGMNMVSLTPQHAASLTGNWITSDHTIVQTYKCGTGMICIRIVQTTDESATDSKNPNTSLRKRSLCGLEIGKDFTVADNAHAKGGKLYDPDSGTTYSSEMSAGDDALKVRGYVGISMFGRTEVWHRNTEDIRPCKTQGQ